MIASSVAIQRIAQAGCELQPEELAQSRPPQVAIDQQYAPSDFRQADAKIRHRGCFACLGARAWITRITRGLTPFTRLSRIEVIADRYASAIMVSSWQVLHHVLVHQG